MKIRRIDHIGIVVDDLEATTAFFLDLGLELLGHSDVEGKWVDRVVGLSGVKAEIAMLATSDGETNIELSKFHHPPSATGTSPAQANTPGIRHIALVVEDIDAIVTKLKAKGAETFSKVQNTRTSTNSATSAAPRASSSSSPRRSANPANPSPAAARPHRLRSSLVYSLLRALRDLLLNPFPSSASPPPGAAHLSTKISQLLTAP